jgi:uncharacterized protein
MTTNTKQSGRTDTAPWYRHRWPWILMSVPAVSVVLGIILVGTAIRNPAILVVDKYYAEGRGINQSLELDRAASELNLQARLSNNNPPTLQLSTDSEAALRLFVYHATDDLRDREFLLLPASEPAVYETQNDMDAESLSAILNSPGAWYLELRGADNNWRLRKRIITPAAREVTL